MKNGTATAYLKQRHRAWSVRVPIPRRLWKLAGGKRELVKALGTRDLTLANQLKWPIVIEFKQRLQELESDGGDLRARVERLEHDVAAITDQDDRALVRDNDPLMDEILDEARALHDSGRPDAAKRLVLVATGKGTPIKPLHQTFLTEEAARKTTPHRLTHHRRVIDRFLAWSGKDTLMEEVNRKKAGAFISYLYTTKLAPGTLAQQVFSLSAFWAWLVRRGQCENNPWRGHKIDKGPKRGGLEVGRLPFTDAELATILEARSIETVRPKSRANLFPALVRLGSRMKRLGARRFLLGILSMTAVWKKGAAFSLPPTSGAFITTR